ncbi:MAG: metalloregulator ArsR/SmtB family transcription factor [Candidatus Acidiferrum sp.]
MALADPTRRGLLERLSREGELTVRALTERSGVSQPAVSKHLRVLKHTGLVKGRHKGRQTHYRVRPRGLAPLVDWLNFYSRFWAERIDRLEELLKRMEQ